MSYSDPILKALVAGDYEGWRDQKFSSGFQVPPQTAYTLYLRARVNCQELEIIQRKEARAQLIQRKLIQPSDLPITNLEYCQSRKDWPSSPIGRTLAQLIGEYDALIRLFTTPFTLRTGFKTESESLHGRKLKALFATTGEHYILKIEDGAELYYYLAEESDNLIRLQHSRVSWRLVR